MRVEEFDYYLPEELIAQTAAEPRHSSRLMVLDRRTGGIEHRRFSDLVEYLIPGDSLIINDSRVIPARLLGQKSTGAQVEILLLERRGPGEVWQALVRPGRRLPIGTRIDLGQGKLRAEIVDRLADGTRLVQLDTGGCHLFSVLDEVGVLPVPPYIHRELENPERYQTVYARERGSVAAPTAGLHFTPELMQTIEEMGVNFGRVTLHVGLGTFRPVEVERVENHVMHREVYSLPEETARLIEATRARGRRVIAVGTTSVRTLEGSFRAHGGLQPGTGATDIFIYPGYQFQVTDALITNFHLPRSTLLMLVSAFAGRELVKQAYTEAVQQRYRFFSLGDAMFIQ
ncbi:MAG: tRNA preQ1(34) S-adenosylmethionine ribosyltransferase-isomerase QueA [Bacillota bacterium]